MCLRKGHFFNLLIVVIALLLIGELFVRLLLTLPASDQSDHELGFMHKPNSVILHTREGYAVNKMNALGFNDRNLKLIDYDYQVLVLGDSITEALQVPQAYNFTSLVEKMFPCIDIYNAGRGGMSPVHYPIVLDRLFQFIEPDKVVIVISFGDIQDLNKKNFEIIRNRVNKNIISLKLKEQQLSKLRVMLDPLLSRSALATYLMRRLKAVGSEEGKKIQVVGKVRNDQDIKEILTYIFTQINSRVPVAILYHPEMKYGVKRTAVSTPRSTQFEGLVQGVAKSIGIPFMSTRFSMKDSYLKYGQPGVGFSNKNILGGHLNMLGHQATAKVLFNLLSEAGLMCSASNN